jgi:eukaryotic-like serine/threonine-protein kinase
MTLAPGSKLGPYEILERIGAGGMGEVYRARDPRVGRDVAIKVSLEQFTDRFSREIHAVAALNHSNVCTLYDVGPNYLVMELIDGSTLADRIVQGAIPLEESLEIARKIADALEAAHEKGIVHRDLKPGNIKIRPDGTVKVLDFGLAKVGGTPAVSLEDSPTLSVAQTAAGVILGTAAYMSPEQARGKPVDKRADIWAFGVVLYEMLTGKQLFSGDTVSDTLAAVLREEPDWEKVPIKVRPLLRRCLEKDPKKRLRDIGEAMAWIESSPESTPVKPSRLVWTWAAIATLMVIALASYAILQFRGKEPAEAMRFHLAVPSMTTEHTMAISPDGRWIAFTSSSSGSDQSLFVCEVGSVTPRRLAGTEGAFGPFWAPDNQWIGFAAGGRLKKVHASGGSPQDICKANVFNGGAWNRDGVIVFSDLPILYRVSAEGGEPSALTTIDKSLKEMLHVFPSFLPDGRHFIYTTSFNLASENAVYLGSLDSKEKTRLPLRGSKAAYTEPGYLVFQREAALFAQSFDAENLVVSGEAMRIADNIVVNTYGVACFGISQNNRLIYRSAGVQAKSQFIWLDRNGKKLSSVGEPDRYQEDFDLSPDGKQIVVIRFESATQYTNIWRMEWQRGIQIPLTSSNKEVQSNVVWAPDGNRVAFSTARKGNVNMYEIKASGIGKDEPILESAGGGYPEDWSKDGRYISYELLDVQSADLFVLPLFGDRKPFPIVQSPSDQDAAHFSDDGKWVAYQSDETGRWEIYVIPFPPTDRKYRISTNGGVQPRWRQDGKELYYLGLDGKLIAVDLKIDAEVNPATPHALFNTELSVNPFAIQYAVTGDGQRFLLLKPLAEATSTPITIILNWTSLLKK